MGFKFELGVGAWDSFIISFKVYPSYNYYVRGGMVQENMHMFGGS